MVMGGGNVHKQTVSGFTFEAGANLAASVVSRNPLHAAKVYGLVDRLYLSGSWRMLHMDIGMKPREKDFGDISITGGDMMYTRNARNIPGVNMWSDWIYLNKGHHVGIKGNYAHYQFIIAGAPARSMEDYAPWLNEENSRYIKILFGQTQSIIRHAEAAVVNSGTASLETVLFNTPQIVGYITNPVTYWIAKKIVKIKYISLGNLIVDRLAFKEYIQDDCNADALVEEVRRLIENKEYRQTMLDNYTDIRNLLGGSGASADVAEAMIRDLKNQ